MTLVELFYVRKSYRLKQFSAAVFVCSGIYTAVRCLMGIVWLASKPANLAWLILH